MRINLRFLGLVLICIVAFLTIGCFLRRDQDEVEPEEVAVAFISVNPTSNEIRINAPITLTFDNDPGEVTSNIGIVSGSGKVRTVVGPFRPGPFTLIIWWERGEGSVGINYIGVNPEEVATQTNIGVDPEEVATQTNIGEVLICVAEVWWITQDKAEAEATTTQRLLQAEGIQTEITDDSNHVKQWMLQTIQDGSVDVAIFYGPIPTTIYPEGNVLPDGSVAEAWIETSDGNTLLNHADWFGFWADGDINIARNDEGEIREGLLGVQNGPTALQNIMDTPGITMWGTNTPMEVTDTGLELTPTLVDFLSDRPFHLDELQGEWFAEAVFASNTGDEQATRADPVIVRDGNLGRIAIVHQTDFEDNPKGEVAAEIIINYLQNN